MKKLLTASGVLQRDSPIVLHISAKRGDSLDLDIVITDLGTSSVFDFSAYDSALMQVRKSRLDAPILTFDSTAVPTEISLQSDRVTLTKTAGSMSAIVGGAYLYDLQLTKTATGEVFTIIGGQFVIYDDITYS